MSHNDEIILPIKLKNLNLETYLTLNSNNDNKIFINLNQNEEDLNNQINECQNNIKEKEEKILQYQSIFSEKELIIEQLKSQISEKDNEIEEYKKNMNNLKHQYEELNSQTQELKAIIQNINNQTNPSLAEENRLNFLKQKFNSVQYSDKYIIKCLQQDLTDYQAYVKELISHKKPVINDILKNLQDAVNEVNPEYKVNLYGSYCTGLCLPWSDIDTVIINENGHNDEYFLSKLFGKLTIKPWVKSYKFIENTSVPIIKLVSNDKFNFHIDISVESEKHFGLKTVDLVKSYLKEYTVLEPIILALKTLLNNGNLNNPYTGGLSSYGLILMVVSFIQSVIDNNKYDKNSETILGETFLNVLGHYGIFFDFAKYVIITYPTDQSLNTEKENSYNFGSNNHELIIVDPLNKQNNVAKSTFQFMNIKMAFMIAYMVAKEDCECGCHYDIISNKHFETEHCIIKRIFNSVKRFSDANKNY